MAAFPVSIASYSFHESLADKRTDIFGYLELLANHYRVRYADIWNGFLMSLEPDYLQKIRLEMNRRDLVLANLCVDGPHLWDPDPEVRSQHEQQALAYIQAARQLGAQTIRIDMGERNPEFSEESFNYIVEQYRKYAAICCDSGIRIGPENHWGASKYPHNLQSIRDAVNHPGYGHLLHLEGFLGADAAKGYDVVLPIVMHTHIPANSLPIAKEIIRRLAASGYAGVYSVEHHSGRLELERTEWQLASLRCLLAELVEEGLEGPASPDFFQETYGHPGNEVAK